MAEEWGQGQASNQQALDLFDWMVAPKLQEIA
jgi:hypothetical protein